MAIQRNTQKVAVNLVIKMLTSSFQMNNNIVSRQNITAYFRLNSRSLTSYSFQKFKDMFIL